MQARTATSPDSTRRREIALGWATSDIGWRKLSAECDAEITYWLMTGPPVFDESDMESALAGEMGGAMVEDHIGRCESCQAWQDVAS